MKIPTTHPFSGKGRDPERIERILNMLKAYWYTYPDMRLGQILINATNPSDLSHLYHMEEDQIEAYLKDQLSPKPTSWSS